MNILPPPKVRGYGPAPRSSSSEAGLRQQAGIAIPELLVGLFVLGTLTVAIASLAALGTRSSARNEYTVTAQALVKEQVEQIIDLPYADVGCRNADPNDPTQVKGKLDCAPTTQIRNNVTFTSTISVIAIDDPLDNPDPPPAEPDRDYKQVTVKVTAANQGGIAAAAQEVTTLVAPTCNCPDANLPPECVDIASSGSASSGNAVAAANIFGLNEANAAGGGSGSAGQDCSTNNDCAAAAGLICGTATIDECTICPDPPCDECESSLDCAGNDSCRPSATKASIDICCTPGEPECPRCTPGTLCPDGQRCPQNGVCNPPTTTTSNTAPTCDAATPCTCGECVSGRCTAVLAKTTDGDCPYGQGLVGTECKNLTPCSDSSPCSSGFCNNGFCRVQDEPEPCACLVAKGTVIDNSRVAHLLPAPAPVTGPRVAAACDPTGGGGGTSGGGVCTPSCTGIELEPGFCCEGGEVSVCPPPPCTPGTPNCPPDENPECAKIPITVDAVKPPPIIGVCNRFSGTQTVTDWREGDPFGSIADECPSVAGKNFWEPVATIVDCAPPAEPRDPRCDTDGDGLRNCGPLDLNPPKNVQPGEECADVHGNDANGEPMRTTCCYSMDTGDTNPDDNIETPCRSDVKLDANGEPVRDADGNTIPVACKTATGADGVCREEDVANSECQRFICSGATSFQPPAP